MGIYQFDREDARRFAQEQGIKTRTRGDELHFFRCPYCQHKTDDKNTFSINLQTGMFKCLRASCGAQGNMITLAKDFNFSLGTETDEYYSPRRRYRNLSNYPRPEVRDPAVEFLEGRGISRAIVEKYSITTQKDAPNILVFPFYDEHGRLEFVKYRKTDFDKDKDRNKEWCEANCKPILFGMDQCDPDLGPLVLTEGQIDSLSVAEAGIPNAVSVPTGAKGFTWVPYCWDFLNKFDTLVVFGDHENGKITLLDEMRTRFRHGTIKHVRPEDYKDCKDANDLLRKYGAEAVQEAVRNATIIENIYIKRLAEVEPRSASALERMSTGIRSLNKLLGGFYFGQLVILTGERGLGKSTLGSQFGTMAVKQGYTTFYYSGELNDWYFQDWFERQMAGPRYINRMVSTLGNEEFSVDGRYIERIRAYYKEQCFIYDNSAIVGEMHESLLQTIKTAITQYGCRVLLIDNLMTAMEDDLTSDLYRQQSVFVRGLTQVVKQFNVLIILVVHPRKSSIRREFQNDDIAGSGNITNLADVILNYAKPDDEDLKNDTDPADRILQVTKNRIDGRTSWSGIQLWYDHASKRIAEDKNFDWEIGWEDYDFVSAGIADEIPF